MRGRVRRIKTETRRHNSQTKQRVNSILGNLQKQKQIKKLFSIPEKTTRNNQNMTRKRLAGFITSHQH